MATINARQLRYVLFAGLIAQFAVGIGLYAFAYSILNGYTKETATLNAKASISDTNVNNLRNLQDYLLKNKGQIERTKQLTPSIATYQDEVISRINTYAAQSNMRITSYNFTTPGATAGSGTGGAAAPAAAAAASAPPAGLKVAMVNFTIGKDKDKVVTYSDLLGFLQRIERSPIRMQVSNVAISSSNDPNNKEAIPLSSLSLEVYVQ
jgi:hypothetical protein